jgi:hypothetical protein
VAADRQRLPAGGERAVMFLFSGNGTDFPEFIEEQDLYQLDETSRDEEELIQRGEKLVEEEKMPVEEYKIRQDGDYYGLYVR